MNLLFYQTNLHVLKNNNSKMYLKKIKAKSLILQEKAPVAENGQVLQTWMSLQSVKCVEKESRSCHDSGCSNC